ncbi:hypothetical protein FA15DRAFT_652304 [Coprinopsis marcescibilis]|uniref:Uncharacterized protein n=1 Tax=Coprinopsis marcescibilis TaxID=230819 RepID=A0A5C3L7Z6_COPMA|nr:hypothetical protein FA15DRAFT_652304 [Coprinopsis marcescibilis]
MLHKHSTPHSCPYKPILAIALHGKRPACSAYLWEICAVRLAPGPAPRHEIEHGCHEHRRKRVSKRDEERQKGTFNLAPAQCRVLASRNPLKFPAKPVGIKQPKNLTNGPNFESPRMSMLRHSALAGQMNNDGMTVLHWTLSSSNDAMGPRALVTSI